MVARQKHEARTRSCLDASIDDLNTTRKLAKENDSTRTGLVIRLNYTKVPNPGVYEGFHKGYGCKTEIRAALAHVNTINYG